MNFQFYLEKLRNSDEFKNFHKENPEAYLCSGFFVVDKEGRDNKNHLDFFIPKTGSMVSFKLENNTKENLSNIDNKIPEKISDYFNFDFAEIESLILKKMEETGVKNKIQKIILSVQKSKNREFVFCTIFTSMFGLIKASISMPEKEIKDFEKKSLFDIVKVTGKKK